MRQTVFAALAVALLSSTAAVAADPFPKKSTKEADVDPIAKFVDEGSQHRTGFYVTGTLGYADIQRDSSHNVTREMGGTGTIPTDASQEELDEYIKSLDAAGVAWRGDAVPGGTVSIPGIIDSFTNRGSDDNLSGLIYGGEISYLWQAPNTRWGVEVGIAADFYNKGKSSSSFESATPTITGGYYAQPEPIGDLGGTWCNEDGTGYCKGAPAGTTINGSMSVDRKLDIDLPIKLHWFLNDRLSIYGGAGPSFAIANLQGSTSTNAPGWMGIGSDYDHSFKDTDTSIGYMLAAGFSWWIANNVRLGAEYNFKQHKFDADGGKSTVGLPDDGVSQYRNVNQHLESEDDVHAIKAKLSIKLN